MFCRYVLDVNKKSLIVHLATCTCSWKIDNGNEFSRQVQLRVATLHTAQVYSIQAEDSTSFPSHVLVLCLRSAQP